jgi:hypothetical protein
MAIANDQHSPLLVVNFLKTHCMHFKTKNSVSTETILAYNNNVITEVSHIKFLGLTIDDTLSWNLQIHLFIYIFIPYSITSLKGRALYHEETDQCVLYG